MKKQRLVSRLLFCLAFCLVLFSGSVFANAVQQVALNKSVTAVGTSRAADVYQINVTSQGKLNVNLRHENLFSTKTYWTVEVFAADLETVLQTFDSIGTDENLIGPSLGLSPGTYYIKVWSRKDCGHEYSDKPYTLTPKFVKSKNWEVEYNSKTKVRNDLQGGAKKISLGKKENGTISASNDKDFYKIDVKEDGCITLKFTHKNVYDDEVCWDIELVNAKTKTICSISSKGTKKTVDTPQIGVTKGIYYIKVESGRKCYTADYSITAKFVKTNNWEKEYTDKGSKTNDSMSSANKISMNKKVQGTISNDNDVDYYKVKVPYSKRVNVCFAHDYKAVKTKYWKVQVYNSKLKEVLVFESRGIDKNMSRSAELKKGTYFVKVSRANKLRTKPYSLTIK